MAHESTSEGPVEETPPPRSQEQQDQKQQHIQEKQEQHRPPPWPINTSRWIMELFIVGHVTAWSIMGVIVRLAVSHMASYEGAASFGLIYAQALGCLIMGILVPSQGCIKMISPHLYVGLGPGFCGTLTTFSSWMLDVFGAFAHLPFATSATRTSSRFHDLLQGVTLTFVTLGVSEAAFRAGTHSGPVVHNYLHSLNISEKQYEKIGRWLDSFFLVFGFLLWLAAILLCALYPPWRHIGAFAVIFAPLGALTRFYLSRYFNPTNPLFPWGTFIANILATGLIAMFAILMYTRTPPSNVSLPLTTHDTTPFQVSCAVLAGLADGFCGALSTVSTFVAELMSIKSTKSSWIYFWSSWITAQVVLVLILGSYSWSNGLHNACNSYIK